MSEVESNSTSLSNPFGLTPNELEALTLVKHDLYQVLIQSSYSRVTMYQFLNRLLVIFQQPTKLTIYQKHGEKYEQIFCTFTDKVSGQYLENHLDGLTQDEIRLYSIQIYDTDYYLLPTKSNRSTGKNSLVIEDKTKFLPLSFEPFYEKEKDDEQYGSIRMLKTLLNTNEMGKDNLFQYLNADKLWGNVLERALDKINNVYVPPRQDTVSNNTYTRYIIESFASEIIDESYREFSKSALLYTNEGLRPPNIVYFIRTYDYECEADTARYNDKRGERGRYNYRIRMLIPAKQEEHFKKAFENIFSKINSSTIDGTWKYGKRKLHHFYNPVYKNHFLDTVKTKKGREKILRILKKPYSKYTRSFTDPSFISSFLDIRRAPLDRMHGLDRLAQHIQIEDINEVSEEIQDEVLRITSLFYLFSIMAPEVLDDDELDNGQSKVSCMIQPLRIGVSPWLSFVSFTEFPDKEKDNYLSWQIYRHWYYDVGTVQGRRIRNRLKQSFLRQVQELTYNIMCLSTNEGPLDVAKLRSALSFYYELSRIYPYRLVSVTLSKQSEIQPNEYAYSYQLEGDHKDDPYFLLIELKANPFYPSHVDRNFTENRKLVIDAIEKGLVRYANE